MTQENTPTVEQWDALAKWFGQLLEQYAPMVADMNKQCGTKIEFKEGWWRDLPKHTDLYIYPSKDPNPMMRDLPMMLTSQLGFETQELTDRKILQNDGLYMRLNIRTIADMAVAYEKKVAGVVEAKAEVPAETIATQAKEPAIKVSLLRQKWNEYKAMGAELDRGFVDWLDKKAPKLVGAAKVVSNFLQGGDIHSGATRG